MRYNRRLSWKPPNPRSPTQCHPLPTAPTRTSPSISRDLQLSYIPSSQSSNLDCPLSTHSTSAFSHPRISWHWVVSDRYMPDPNIQNTPHISPTPHFLLTFFICSTCATHPTYSTIPLSPILSYTPIFTSAINYELCNANAVFISIPASTHSFSSESYISATITTLLFASTLIIFNPISFLQTHSKINTQPLPLTISILHLPPLSSHANVALLHPYSILIVPLSWTSTQHHKTNTSFSSSQHIYL